MRAFTIELSNDSKRFIIINNIEQICINDDWIDIVTVTGSISINKGREVSNDNFDRLIELFGTFNSEYVRFIDVEYKNDGKILYCINNLSYILIKDDTIVISKTNCEKVRLEKDKTVTSGEFDRLIELVGNLNLTN